jgi:hypothetical protein
MHYHPIVIRSSGPLRQEVWSFCVLDFQIVLDAYWVVSRATLRHKFKLDSRAMYYARLSSRDSTVEVDSVPLPDDVAAEARQQVIDKFRVVREYCAG